MVNLHIQEHRTLACAGSNVRHRFTDGRVRAPHPIAIRSDDVARARPNIDHRTRLQIHLGPKRGGVGQTLQLPSWIIVLAVAVHLFIGVDELQRHEVACLKGPFGEVALR